MESEKIRDKQIANDYLDFLTLPSGEKVRGLLYRGNHFGCEDGDAPDGWDIQGSPRIMNMSTDALLSLANQGSTSGKLIPDRYELIPYGCGTLVPTSELDERKGLLVGEKTFASQRFLDSVPEGTLYITDHDFIHPFPYTPPQQGPAIHSPEKWMFETGTALVGFTTNESILEAYITVELAKDLRKEEQGGRITITREQVNT